METSAITTETAEAFSAKSKATSDSNNLLLITYYTDPLCCWSWSTQGNLERVMEEYTGRVEIRYVMSVLFPAEGPRRSPLEMAAEWNFAAIHTGTANDNTIWITDPPSSSYQACLAVKTAALQSPMAEQLYLKKLREAVMTRRLNISKNSVITRLAEELADEYTDDFKLLRFVRNFSEEKARRHLEKDIHKRDYHGVAQLPTFHFSTSQGKKIILSGYKDYDLVRQAMRLIGF